MKYLCSVVKKLPICAFDVTDGIEPRPEMNCFHFMVRSSLIAKPVLGAYLFSFSWVLVVSLHCPWERHPVPFWGLPLFELLVPQQ
jgi:hypothetical protein